MGRAADVEPLPLLGDISTLLCLATEFLAAIRAEDRVPDGGAGEAETRVLRGVLNLAPRYTSFSSMKLRLSEGGSEPSRFAC